MSYSLSASIHAVVTVVCLILSEKNIFIVILAFTYYYNFLNISGLI